MTPKVCFEFCRTVPGMLFFGLIYGRECYCTPYFTPTTAKGNGVCDLPCEGDAGSTCGGNGMSDMYEMHFCDDTAEKLDEQIAKAKNATMKTESLSDHTGEAGESMEGAANEMMTAAAEGGDMATNDLGQQAKGFTSEVVHSAATADKAAEKLDEARLEAEKLVGKDFTIPEYMEDAEKAIKKMKELRKVCEGGSRGRSRAQGRGHGQDDLRAGRHRLHAALRAGAALGRALGLGEGSAPERGQDALAARRQERSRYLERDRRREGPDRDFASRRRADPGEARSDRRGRDGRRTGPRRAVRVRGRARGGAACRALDDGVCCGLQQSRGEERSGLLHRLPALQRPR